MKRKLLLLAFTGFLLTGCTLKLPIQFISKSSSESSSSNTSSSNGSSSSSHGGSSSSSSHSSSSSSSSSGSGGDVTPSGDTNDIQNMNILHAWNWKLNDIKSRLSAIKNAGYGAVQISPMQPKVDKTGWSDQSTSSQWWKFYQPLAFKVAESGESFLGTKSDLTTLCSEAKKQNIKIVVDKVRHDVIKSSCLMRNLKAETYLSCSL